MNEQPVLVEACVTSSRGASQAFTDGARRVELCRSLDVGGLSPSASTLVSALSDSPGPLFVLVRPDASTFRLTSGEATQVVAEVDAFATLGVDGIVVGVLDRAGRIDLPVLRELVSAAGGLPVTFHRAYDRLDDPVGGLDVLRQAGVRRVLTSGGAETAWEGRAVLRDLVESAGSDLTILGGGSIRGDHVRELVATTGLREVHARASAIPGIMDALRPA